MEILDIDIQGPKIIIPKVFGDSRGYFLESFRKDVFEQDVCKTLFVQDNESKSVYGVVRGLHFQKPPYSQSKLIRVVKGTVYDVIVDIRKGSPTFGKHFGIELSDENKKQLFVPRGFAHGFSVLSDEVIFQYKCDNFYNAGSEGGIAWDDVDLGIDWKVPADKIILSGKDKMNPRLKDSELFFDFNVNYYE
jgi:dTDP-4-dehydrorhamnose 3,5-epimerase